MSTATVHIMMSHDLDVMDESDDFCFLSDECMTPDEPKMFAEIVSSDASEKENEEILSKERIQLHSLIRHTLSVFQNVTQKIAIIALHSLVNTKLFETSAVLLQEWHIYDHIALLRQLLNNLAQNNVQSVGIHPNDAQWAQFTFERERKTMIKLIGTCQTSYDYMRKAMLLRFEFKPYMANKCFKKSIELNPHSYESIYSRAMIALRLNKTIDYLKQLSCALYICEREIALMECRPTWFDHGLVTRARSFCHSIRGRILIKRKLYAASLREYESAMNVDRSSMYAHFYLGFYYSFEGKEKDDEMSTRYFLEALKLTGVERRDVYASLIYDNLGQVFESADRFEDALQFYTKSLEANSRYGWGYQNRALLLPEMNRYDEAVADNTKCIEFEPEMPSILSDLYAERARSYFNLGNSETCIHDLQNAKRLDPTLEYPYVMLSYLESGDHEKALQLLDEGIMNCRGESADLLSVLSRKYWFYTTIVNDPQKANEAKITVERFEKSHFRIE
jgi:tetratricopeptide (TPR) repeat protein